MRVAGVIMKLHVTVIKTCVSDDALNGLTQCRMTPLMTNSVYEDVQ